MDIKRLAHRTADFNFLRMYPIAIHLLMTLAHSRVFDGLPLPWLPLMLYTIDLRGDHRLSSSATAAGGGEPRP